MKQIKKMSIALAFLSVYLIVFQINAENRLLTKKTENGSYFAIPNMLNEESSFLSPISFKKSPLMDADHRSNSCWWGTASGSIFLNLNKSFHISKVRVNLVITGAGYVVGTEKISLATWKEIQEASLKNTSLESGTAKVCRLENDFAQESVRPMLEITPVNGWNEININKVSNLIMLKFDLMKGKKVIVVSEIEIWGKDPDDLVQATECDKFNETLKNALEKEKNMRLKLEKMPNLAYSENAVKCWTTLLPWRGTTMPEMHMLSQKDGNMTKDATWSQKTNFWAACSPAQEGSNCDVPQILIINLPREETITVNRLIAYSANSTCRNYSLEYFTDGKWKLLYHDKANSGQVATYQFSPISTDKLRLTMYDFEGTHRLMMRSFQLYNLEGNK